MAGVNTTGPALPGELTQLAIVLATGGAYVIVFQVTSDISFGGAVNRETSLVTSRGDDVGVQMNSPIAVKGPFTVEGNHVQSDSTLGVTTGLHEYAITGAYFDMQIQGPEFSVGVTDDMRVHVSVTNYEIMSPRNALPHKYTVTFQPSGIYKLNANIIGTAASDTTIT